MDMPPDAVGAQEVTATDLSAEDGSNAGDCAGSPTEDASELFASRSLQDLEGVMNARDLSSVLPGVILPHRVVRSATPAGASPADVIFLLDTLNLRTVRALVRAAIGCHPWKRRRAVDDSGGMLASRDVDVSVLSSPSLPSADCVHVCLPRCFLPHPYHLQIACM